ncbi:GSCFA domain-containing protein [Idiomarina aquatica]|uniref:GSCFA family protein n=1 Tax=Idiomarina aquatica TaxID=1327752 RepID=A0AA94EGN5_9GAMM|nr:GSCFA domain-containing protein [Idiomarina aquatica]RUO45161.1 GSCFA family protein [Idiomarina aquatica]
MEPNTPYSSLPDKAFWRTAVAQKSLFDITGLWDPKFKILPKHNVATYGSCFAQHIGNALSERGFSWLRTEVPPTTVPIETAKQYGYHIFSSRTANIYTTSLLHQWVRWADGEKSPNLVWKQSNKYFDPFRPKIEPHGFSSEEEVLRLRQYTIEKFKQSITEANFFVFTLGLTESWFDRDGFEYPMCPGTVAGEFDAERHQFENQSFKFIKDNLLSAIAVMRKMNPKLRFILTVSPVPLTATASGKHVLTATMHSKSLLRAVAATVSETKHYIDYFPSYEIINSPAFKGVFFEPNMRSVNPAGVNFVMNSFFQGLHDKFGINETKERTVSKSNMSPSSVDEEIDQHCEEALLEAFGNA